MIFDALKRPIFTVEKEFPMPNNFDGIFIHPPFGHLVSIVITFLHKTMANGPISGVYSEFANTTMAIIFPGIPFIRIFPGRLIHVVFVARVEFGVVEVIVLEFSNVMRPHFPFLRMPSDKLTVGVIGVKN